LHHIANILQVPVAFFFEDVPGQAKVKNDAPSPAYVSDFLATTDGLALTKAFMQIKDGLPCFSPENRDIFQEKQGGD
jgi:hypothetical protein